MGNSSFFVACGLFYTLLLVLVLLHFVVIIQVVLIRQAKRVLSFVLTVCHLSVSPSKVVVCLTMTLERINRISSSFSCMLTLLPYKTLLFLRSVPPKTVGRRHNFKGCWNCKKLLKTLLIFKNFKIFRREGPNSEQHFYTITKTHEAYQIKDTFN